jgi:hypothetical protein
MRKYISLKDAHSILENCSAVIWGDNFLSYPSVSDLENKGDSSNDFLYRVSGSTMFLIDDKGNEVDIAILNSDDGAFEKCENIGGHEI